MREKEYIIHIDQIIHVVAKNREAAEKLIKENPPWTSLLGAGEDGYYSIESKNIHKIISVKEKKIKD